MWVTYAQLGVCRLILNHVDHSISRKPWYSDPKHMEQLEHTVIGGLRRLGFPES